jgi:hydroxymethylbilane synthase
MRRLRIGTRASALAVTQTEIVAAAVRAAQPDIELEVVTFRTEGDRRQDVTLEQIGGQGVFVKEIEQALLRREIDIAVHSLKDMPAGTPTGLTIAAVLPRADARDALVSNGGGGLHELPSNPRIGTDSRRRAVQLKALRPDAVPTSVRGNVETRIRKTESGELDAVVLAVAGLERLGLLDRAAHIFTPDEMLPAVGQGVLAVETRLDDDEAFGAVSVIDDDATSLAVTAERAYLGRLGAGCRLPVAAYAEVDEGEIRMRALLADAHDNVHRIEGLAYVADAEDLGISLATRLLEMTGSETPR